MIKRPPKSRAICFERMGRAEHPPPPVYAFKCLLPVSSEMKGKVVCNASALSVSHLISCLTHYSDFSGQSSAKAVFLGFCSRLVFQFSSECELDVINQLPIGISTVCWQSLQSKWHRNKTHLSRRIPNGLLIVFLSFTLFFKGKQPLSARSICRMARELECQQGE